MKRIVLCLSLDSNRTENEIGRGGVYGATATIFREGNPISRKKNRFLAIFSCAQRARLKIVEGVVVAGELAPPSTGPLKADPFLLLLAKCSLRW